MGNLQDYESKLGAINAIADDEISKPSIPVDVFMQEAENLFTWCEKDKEALTGSGLNWDLVTDLPARAGALRQAEAQWFSERFTRAEARRDWQEIQPRAFELRGELIDAMTYAFRNMPDLIERVRAVREGGSNPDTIQDLVELAVLARKNSGPLETIKFDMSLIDAASDMSDKLADLLARAVSDDETIETKKIRDRAYTHLKEAVDEIRDCGRYALRKDSERLRGYGSNYKRQHRSPKNTAVEQGAPVSSN